MSDVLNVEVRENMGTAATRKLRDSGLVPAVVYGHGGDNQHLSVPRTDVELMLRHQSKHVQLAGAATDHVLVKDLQWDPLGIEVLHLDLLRVSLSEKVTLTVPIKLHGDVSGVSQHGILNEVVHAVEIRVSAVNIPESLELNINDLEVGQSKLASDIELPEGVELVTDPTTVVVQLNAPQVDRTLEEETDEAGAEPEVIGEPKDEEE